MSSTDSSLKLKPPFQIPTNSILGGVNNSVSEERQIRSSHMCISIPPKYLVSHVIGYIKGKSAISIAYRLMGKAKNFTGENFWARGYFVSTVGLDEEMVREYIRNQEKEDEHYDQLKLGI